MQDVGHEGRTVLFVSHHMPSIKSLCARALHLDQGRVVEDGPAAEVVDRYLNETLGSMPAARVWDNPAERPGNSHFRLRALRVLDPHGQVKRTYNSSEPVIVEMEFDLDAVYTALVVGFDLVNRDGVVVFKTSHNDRHEREWPAVRPGRNTLQCAIPEGLLNEGTYSVVPKVGLHANAWFLNGNAEVSFDVIVDHSESPFWNVQSREKFNGVIAPCLQWRAAEPSAGLPSCQDTSSAVIGGQNPVLQ
jgi:lipopolysaccharide transport system ATP-binding protein